MTDALSPEAVAQAKRQTMLDTSPQAFSLWLHNPLTAAFFQYLADQVASFREVAADLVEAGAFTPGARGELNNPDVVRGQILALKQVREVTAQTIQSFYGQEAPDEQAAS